MSMTVGPPDQSSQSVKAAAKMTAASNMMKGNGGNMGSSVL